MAEVKVFTLNIWGIGFGISADRVIRVKAISDFVSKSDNDIILLQEVWMPSDWELIKSRTQDAYPYNHFFDNGIAGSGTCVLSKHVIMDTTFHEFSLNGYPHKIHQGDFYAGKGLGVAQILFKGYVLHVFVSHLHAEYCRSQDMFLGHRVMQALEAAQWIKLTTSGADLTIYAGDFNTEPTDNPYAIFRTVSQLSDCWAELNPAAVSEGKGGETCATPYNTYTAAWERNDFPNGKRIDYIMYSSGPNTKARAVECTLPLPVRIPSSYGAQVSYSDHEAVQATILIQDLDQNTSQEGDAPNNNLIFRRNQTKFSQARHDCVTESLELIKSAQKVVVTDMIFYAALCALSLFLFLASFSAFFLTESVLVDALVFFVRFVLVLSTIYTLFMASLFNKREKNALMSAAATLDKMVHSTKYSSI